MSTLASGALAPVLAIVDGTVTTTSLDVAKFFGKRHDHVIRDIRNIISSIPSEWLPNFGDSTYLGEDNIPQPCYRLTRDAFTLLAMGFTGKRALMFKLAYIAEFNRMDAALNGRAQAAPPLPAPRKPAFSVEFSDGTAFHFGSVPCHE
ncbi:hypothetical protein CCP3SC1_70048 [Gammaproteobacteria bacterium]